MEGPLRRQRFPGTSAGRTAIVSARPIHPPGRLRPVVREPASTPQSTRSHLPPTSDTGASAPPRGGSPRTGERARQHVPSGKGQSRSAVTTSSEPAIDPERPQDEDPRFALVRAAAETLGYEAEIVLTDNGGLDVLLTNVGRTASTRTPLCRWLRSARLVRRRRAQPRG